MDEALERVLRMTRGLYRYGPNDGFDGVAAAGALAVILYLLARERSVTAADITRQDLKQAGWRAIMVHPPWWTR
ncbi:hypothetical protein ACH4C2_37630 [Streptomyces sp. NPDC018057]|uniref:hypothetical protein n=1 Tax=unclassified Streptomyces TaxID=2593676 RepID=UPI0037BB864C